MIFDNNYGKSGLLPAATSDLKLHIGTQPLTTITIMTDSTTEPTSSTHQSHLKLSYLHRALREHLDNRYFHSILARNGDINHRSSNGRAALFFAFAKRNVKIFNLLLNHGADFTTKDDDDSTVLHRILEDKHAKHSDNWELKGRIEDAFVDSVLSSHVQFDVQTNPRNRYGLTHFHAACMTDNARAVDFFLRNGAYVDESVNPNSPVFPGYTPLHFASRFCALKVAEILLGNNANMHVKDARGMTPLHLLLERNLKIMRERRVNLMTDVATNEKIVNLLLENDTIEDSKLSKFHVACATRDALLARRFLKHAIDVDRRVGEDSPVVPGCTALHLAALSSVDTTKMLVSRGASLVVEDVDGITPMDICLERYGVEDLHDILECRSMYHDVAMSDGRTKLLDVLLAMRSLNDFATLLRNFDDVDVFANENSPLWPRYTSLHLAITLYSKTKNSSNKRTYLQVIKECLNRGANVANAVHLAFKLGEFDLVNLLLQYHEPTTNFVGNEGWSHLHVACAAANLPALEKLVTNGADVKVPVGSSFRTHSLWVAKESTALHIAVVVGCTEMVGFWLRQGVDVYVRDEDGFTAIHRLVTCNASSTVGLQLLTVPNLKDSVVDGLSHLHVACFYNCATAVKKLLHLGANIDEVIENDLVEDYFGLTPLRLAIRRGHWDLAKLLVQLGAKVTSDVLLEALKDRYASYQDPFVSVLKRNRSMMEDLDGMSLLHVGCKKVDVKMVRRELRREDVDVNQKMRGGNTALHVLMTEASEFMHDHQRQIDVDAVLKLLLDGGADVSVVNEGMQTPLHMADKLFYIYMDQPLNSPYGLRVDAMLKSIKNFSTNPVDADGVSHFHIACSWNSVDVVEEFLKAGVAVNQATDYFADQYAGCTALHLTLSSQTKSFTGVEAQLRTVELLLKYGADAGAEDSRGNRPLHTAAKYGPPRERLFEMIVGAGVDINAKNIYGETPLEILLKSKDVSAEEINFFLDRNCRVNDFNPVNHKGYIPMTFSTRHHDVVQKLVFEAMIAASNIADLDDTGCTAIHNVVSTGSPIITDDEYADLIERLIKLGCDIDCQDKLGKTALHTAAQFQNDRAIAGLLSAGADINVVDAKGKPAFAYSLEPCKLVFDEYREGRNEIIKRTFAVHVHKMQLGKLDVSPPNKRVQVSVVRRKAFDVGMSKRFHKEIETMKDVKIECSRSLFLHDFMSETGAVIDYPSMTFLEREAVDDFFENGRASLTSRFGEVAHIVRLQYRKALARFSLMESAKASLMTLTGVPFPDPCSEAIFGYLKNSELKDLVEASG